MPEPNKDRPIVIRKGSFGSYTLIDYNSPLYLALGQKIRVTNYFRNKEELMVFLEKYC